MGFRVELTDLDQLEGVDVDLVGTFATSLPGGPRIVVEQVDNPDYDPANPALDVVDATVGRVLMESSAGAPGELSLTTSQLLRRLLLSAGKWHGSESLPDYPDGYPAPHLAMSIQKVGDAFVRAAAVDNVDYLAVAGDVRAPRFVATGDNYNYVSAAPEAGWTSTISRYTVRQGEVTYTCRLTRSTWAANQRIFVFPAAVWPKENCTFWSGGNEVILRASDGVMYLPFSGSTGVQFTATWPVG